MRTVDSAYVEMLYDYLNMQGIDAEKVLGSLISHGGRVSVSTWKQMLASAKKIVGRDLFGLRVAEILKISHYGYFGYLLLNADSLLECVALSQENTSLISDNNPTQINLTDGAIDIHIPQVHGWVGQDSDEVGIGSILAFLGLITKEKIRPLHVEFVIERPVNALQYEQYFDASVRFGASMPRILLPIEVLNKSKAEAKVEDYLTVDNWVARQLQHAGPLNPELQSIRVHLLQLIRQGQANLNHLAKLRNCSVRTMQRLLEDKGSSFQVLLNQTRHWLALEYLRDERIALSEISHLLGYANQTAFNRAFAQWTGKTPMAFRRSKA